MTLKSKPIYVEIDIQATMDDVWQATQEPDLHAKWDVRFSSITYLPKKADEPQAFTYERRVAPFLTVKGWGKSSGATNNSNGSRSSALHFGTDQWFSPIREGRGYWKYVPIQGGVKFLTQYDYEPNFSSFGKIVDRCIFKPMMGWATALSFDVLKRWLEQGEAPRSQYIRFFYSYGLALLFAFVWMYQGLIPKILAKHPEEMAMVASAFSTSPAQTLSIVFGIGIAEVLFGLLWLFYRKKKHLFALQLAIFPLLTIAAIGAVPETAVHPFNPVTFNVALLTLSLIGYFSSGDVPTAKSCKRKR
ncbi:DoxX-like family protein [Sporosarcina sp. OR05]|uniref:DoxX-like family protein n=1 Tax=Sporosarcina sp. OR05 TaxID=2969819 RepID=UPI00352AFF77